MIRKSLSAQFLFSVILAVASFCLVSNGCKSKKKAGSSVAALNGVPAEAAVVLTIDSPKAFWDHLVGKGMLPMDKDLADQLDKELTEHVKEHIGLDISEVRSIVGFLLPPGEEGGGPRVAAIISGVSGDPKLGEEVDGTHMLPLDPDVFIAYRDGRLIVGHPGAVESCIEVLAGKSKALDGDLVALVKDNASGTYLGLSADLSKLPLPPGPMSAGLKTLSFRVSGSSIYAALEGDNDTLDLLRTQIKTGIEFARSTFKSQKENLSEMPIEGAAALIGYYNFENFSRLVDPKLSGERLSIELSMGDMGGAGPMLLVSGVGVMAAVAIPAFMKYIKKSKTAEASQFLRKMSDGLRMHYAETQTLPESVGPTPPLHRFCEEDEKFAPNPEDWAHPTWSALQFAINDPHYYSYEVEVVGDTVILKARGDLDCDGMYSEFSIYGEIIDGELETTGDVLKRDALE